MYIRAIKRVYYINLFEKRRVGITSRIVVMCFFLQEKMLKAYFEVRRTFRKKFILGQFFFLNIMIKAIIFDLAGVITTNTSGFEKQLEHILNIDKEKLIGTWKGQAFYDFLFGKISEDDYWNIIISKNNWNVEIQLLKNAIRNHFKIIEETIIIIKSLKKQGFKLGILSGHTKEWIKYLNDTYDFEKYFDVVIYSYQKGYSKPSKMFYEDILSEINIKPELCIYTDDKEEFLTPAKELGMHTILFQTPGQFKKKLAPYSINIE